MGRPGRDGPVPGGSRFVRHASDLLGAVLTTGVRNIVKEGSIVNTWSAMNHSANSGEAPLFSESVARMEPPRAVLTCRFEEFTEDMDHNRLLKAALRIISRHPEASTKIRKQAKQCLPAFHRVSDIVASLHDFNSIVFGPKLTALSASAPHRQDDHHGLRTRGVGVRKGIPRIRHFELHDHGDPVREVPAPILCEARPGIRVAEHKPPSAWNATPRQGADPSLLPVMNTDITLERPSRSTIIEAKFYGGGAFTGRHNQPKFRSDHLYQLYAYLDNRSATMTEADGELTGLLLYADVTGGNITEPWTIGRHQMTIASVDLSAPWKEIHDRLMQLGHES